MCLIKPAHFVYDPNDPYADLYDVDDDTTVITLADWYHIAARLGAAFPAGPDSILINGLGRAVDGDTTNLTVISVEQGKRYRIRLISMSCDPNFTFSIDSHNMTIIEVDGPSCVTPAQRMDPTSNQTTSVAALNEADLVPLVNATAPGEAVVGGVDYALNLDFNFNVGSDCSGPPSNGSVYTLPSNSTIEISMPGTANAPGTPHPFHLHGHTFSVVRVAGSDTYNYDNPVQRDTVSTGVAGDNVTIRFTTDNPGPWFLHCHIDLHSKLALQSFLLKILQTLQLRTLCRMHGAISARLMMPWMPRSLSVLSLLEASLSRFSSSGLCLLLIEFLSAVYFIVASAFSTLI
ncbi:Laccase-4 [Grifola frondosa]|uniref:laccase n=1 Tax=Grifola frondosa TaxID=5627 RepID=A0A1C7LKY9_GRIFR|nr:Laccase-4 [Grifola frondosa]